MVSSVIWMLRKQFVDDSKEGEGIIKMKRKTLALIGLKRAEGWSTDILCSSRSVNALSGHKSLIDTQIRAGID